VVYAAHVLTRTQCQPLHALQAGQRGDLSAVLGVVESAGKQFDDAAVEAALTQVGSWPGSAGDKATQLTF
jgi:hypothetical protein